jgi:hypothetical protein
MTVPLKSLPLMLECRLMVVRNWTNRNIFGPMLVQEARNWINLHNEGVFTNFFKMTVSRKIRWAGNMARMEEKISAFMVLVFRPDRQV